jgi:hypothetical protein
MAPMARGEGINVPAGGEVRPVSQSMGAVEGDDDDSQYVLMVSGLRMGSRPDDLSTQLLVDWISGHLGSPTEQRMAAKVREIRRVRRVNRKRYTASL